MANRTKAELINEIEHLRSENYERSDRLREKSKQIKQLQADAVHDAKESDKKSKEIKDLQDVVIALRNDCNNLTAEKHEKANKVKDLEQVLKSAVDMRDYWLEEKDSEIKELQADLEFANTAHRDKDIEIKRLRVLLRGADQIIDENAKEISNLDRAVAQVGGVIADKDSKINDLEDVVRANDALISRQVKEIQGFELVCDAKVNRIKELEGTLKTVRDLRSKNVMENSDLRADYDNRQAIITEMSKEIEDLKRRLKLSEKFSGNKEFHNATEAMGNPLYFQGV